MIAARPFIANTYSPKLGCDRPKHPTQSLQHPDGEHGPDVQAATGVEPVTAEDEVRAVAGRAVGGLRHVVDIAFAAQSERPGHIVRLRGDGP